MIVAMITSTVLSYALSLSHAEITNMVEKIKHQRTGIDLESLENTPNPFNINKREEKDTNKEAVLKEAVYNLTAIFNRAAFINGKWYKSGEQIDNYTISKVGKKSVILVNGSNRKTLALPKKKSIINFKGR